MSPEGPSISKTFLIQVKAVAGAAQNKSKLKGTNSLTSYSKSTRMFEFPLEREEEPTERSNFLAESCLPEEKVLRLCLHGNAVVPDFLIQPNCFDLGDLHLGQTVDKVLRVTNCTIIPVLCRPCKAVNIKVSPKEVWLKSEKAHEFAVRVSPKSAGIFKTKMKVEILAKSDAVFDTDKTLVIVAVYTIVLNYNAQNVFRIPEPKIGLGITPLITDGVGLQKDSITFKDADKIPFAAVLRLKHGFRTTWMRNEEDKLNNVENAIVALPNDRPRLYYTWPKDKICRTIFSGFFRYAPPEDLAYTFSAQERNKRIEQKGIWIDYLSFLKALRKAKYPNPQELNLCLEYDIGCQKHYNMKQMKLPLELQPLLESFKKSTKCFKETKDIRGHIFVPLSPVLLSNITIEPKIIDFGQVAVNTAAKKQVSICNINNFSISIKFVSVKSSVTVMELNTITVQPSTTRHIQVLFQSKDLGRYFGFLNYVINGSHEFKISISAFVTSKTLTLGESPLNIQFGLYDTKEAFQPRSVFLTIKNLLQSPIKYRWNISPDSSFLISLIEGEIPPRDSLLTEVLFDVCPRKSFYSEMSLISESGNSEAVKLVYQSKKVAVNFLSSRVDMNDIPLNLPTVVHAIIQNACYHEVAFEVLDANPMPGIIIEPKQGIIKPRSFFPLQINAQIPVIMKFNFCCVLLVHFINRISVKVTGNVVAPVIRMKPTEVVMRKICAHAIDTFAICVENAGKTPAEVLIDFKTCPEYKIVDNNHKLYLMPKQSSRFLIQFEPTDVSRYMFYLPVTINRILGPPEMQEPETEYVHFYLEQLERWAFNVGGVPPKGIKSDIGNCSSMYEQHGSVFKSSNSGLKIPCVCLNSTVIPGLLTIISRNVNFKLESKNPIKPQNIVFANECNDDITFCIRNDDLGESRDSPFNLIPINANAVENRLRSYKVNLKQGENLVMKATFEPKRPGSYSAEVPVFVRGYSNGLVYNFVNLKGEFKLPKIIPEAKELHFPPLPLDVGCDVTVTICAENYFNSETINCIVYDPREENGEQTSQYIYTKWLSEPNVSPCQQSTSFQLLINFRSSIPVALKNYILLFDLSGVYSSIFVTAIADNSVLTDHAFLATRNSKYRLIRDKPPQIWMTPEIPSYPINKAQLKILEKIHKDRRTGSKSGAPGETSENPTAINICMSRVDRGPRLIIQETKSMSRPTQLGFVNVPRHTEDCKTSSSTFIKVTKSKIITSFISKPESINGSKTYLNASLAKRAEMNNDVSYPNFPVQEGLYQNHFEKTLIYAERWIFEVVMRCDQYFSIPTSFQHLMEEKPSKSSKKAKIPETRVEKDFLDFLKEVVGPDYSLPKRIAARDYNAAESKAIKLQAVYADILRFLESNGCLLPHVRPEFLMEYTDYIQFRNELKNTETFSWKSVEEENLNSLRALQDVMKSKPDNLVQKSSSIFSPRDSWKKSLFEGYIQSSETEIDKTEEKIADAGDTTRHKEPYKDLMAGRQFAHSEEILDEENFQLRSKQAWLDIVIQLFRVFAMKKVVLKNTVPQISVIGMGDKISVQAMDLIYNKRSSDVQPPLTEDSLGSNIYTLQERILLDWLNHHCQIQQKKLWSCMPRSESPSCKKIVNNFDKDLSDSIALISVTASHCPYIVSEYFANVFHKPDSPNKMYHNACKLIEAWRALEIGLTVETADIVQANPVFMVILVAQLYYVLPSLHPRFLVCFSAPLATDTTRGIQLRNDSQERIFYKAKFFGEHEGFFDLGKSTVVELKPNSTTEVNLKFTARKIKRIFATLVFSGCFLSPNFGKHLAFYLEGEPSELPECNQHSFTAPLYKVICNTVPVKPPFIEPATYEVWYTTNRPQYSETVDISESIKPWSKIKNRKISRRLFLNQSEVTINENSQETTLSVTVACLTEHDRMFWLLFRSNVCDFIILIEIKTKLMESQTILKGFYAEGWSPSATCLCPGRKKLPKPNTSPSGCPFLTEVKIPTRNDALWNSLWAMFLKTLQPHERSFWNKHFEMDIGICLILWLLSPDEEQDVIDEFVHVLPTRMTYTLKVEPPNDAHVIIPATIEISDVRKEGEISLPIHIMKSAPTPLLLRLIMTSENGKEIRSLAMQLTPPNKAEEEGSN